MAGQTSKAGIILVRKQAICHQINIFYTLTRIRIQNHSNPALRASLILTKLTIFYQS